MSVVLSLENPQSFEVDASTKPVRKMQESSFKIMKKKATALFYDFTVMSLGSLKKKEKQKLKKLFIYF